MNDGCAVQDMALGTAQEPHPALVNNLIEKALGVAAAVFAALVLVGIVMRYSPIPYGDDWGEYIARPGLFSLNNAHRLVVSRLIMWVDWSLGAKFLVMFAAAIAMRIGILILTLRINPGNVALQCVLACSWMQATSFYHSFVGISEFSAILLPLIAFHYRSVAAGFASIGTLATGLLVLPVMALWGSITAGLVAVVGFALYFHGFVYPNNPHPAPLNFMLFVFTYLGSPFYFVVYYWAAGLQHLADWNVTDNYLSYPVSREFGLGTAAGMGVFLLLGCQRPFVLFVVLSACLTAWGRAHEGWEMAIQERYTVGPLVAWALLVPRSNLLALAIVVGLLPNQLKTVLKHDSPAGPTVTASISGAER